MQVNFVDFETGDLSQCLAHTNTVDFNGNPLLGVDSAIVHRGNYAMIVRGTGENVANVTIGQDPGHAFNLATVYYNWYFYLSTRLGRFSMANSLDAGGNPKFLLTSDINGTLNLQDHSGVLAAAPAPIVPNVWHVLGLQLGTGPGAAVEWHMDGALIFRGTSTDNGTSNHVALQLGSTTFDQLTIRYDDVAIDNSQFPALLAQTSDALGVADAVADAHFYQQLPARVIPAHWGPLPGRQPFPSSR